VEELSAAESIPGMEEYVEESELPASPDQIVRRKEVLLGAMDEAEAIEQMELLGHTFFLFFNASSGAVNVLYKRATGGYGLLVPRVE
jgi:putative sigma-54 modulation protein